MNPYRLGGLDLTIFIYSVFSIRRRAEWCRSCGKSWNASGHGTRRLHRRSSKGRSHRCSKFLRRFPSRMVQPSTLSRQQRIILNYLSKLYTNTNFVDLGIEIYSSKYYRTTFASFYQILPIGKHRRQQSHPTRSLIP